MQFIPQECVQTRAPFLLGTALAWALRIRILVISILSTLRKVVFNGRSAARALDLIRRLAVVGAKAGVSGVGGLDEDNGVETFVITFCMSRKGRGHSTSMHVARGGKVTNVACFLIFRVCLKGFFGCPP